MTRRVLERLCVENVCVDFLVPTSLVWINATTNLLCTVGCSLEPEKDNANSRWIMHNHGHESVWKFRDQYDWMTRVPDNGNEWRKFSVVPRLHPLCPLVLDLVYYQRHRNDNINNICILWRGKFTENCQKTLFFLGNSMTIKFRNFANFIVRNFVVIWEAPITKSGNRRAFSLPGEGRGHFHCTVGPSSGHIRCRKTTDFVPWKCRILGEGAWWQSESGSRAPQEKLEMDSRKREEMWEIWKRGQEQRNRYRERERDSKPRGEKRDLREIRERSWG